MAGPTNTALPPGYPPPQSGSAGGLLVPGDAGLAKVLGEKLDAMLVALRYRTSPPDPDAVSQEMGTLEEVINDLRSTLIDQTEKLRLPSPLPLVGFLVNPVSLLQRPADTTAYAQNDLIASDTTAGKIAVPSFQLARVNSGSAILRKFRLITDLTTGAAAFQGFVEFWSAPPTFTNGDNGAYAVAKGALGWLGSSTTSVFTQVADGAYASGVPTTGSEFGIALQSGQQVWWTLKEADATGLTPISQQKFYLIPEIYQN